MLLFKQFALNLCHVGVVLEHLGKEVVWARDGNLSLNEDVHAFHHVFTSGVVEGYLAFDVVVNSQCGGCLG